MAELKIKENQYYNRIVPTQINSGNIELGDLQESFLPLHEEHCRYESCTKEEFEAFQKSAQVKNLTTLAAKTSHQEQLENEHEEVILADNNPDQGYSGVCKSLLILVGIISLWVLLANVLPQKNRNS